MPIVIVWRPPSFSYVRHLDIAGDFDGSSRNFVVVVVEKEGTGEEESLTIPAPFPVIASSIRWASWIISLFKCGILAKSGVLVKTMLLLMDVVETKGATSLNDEEKTRNKHDGSITGCAKVLALLCCVYMYVTSKHIEIESFSCSGFYAI